MAKAATGLANKIPEMAAGKKEGALIWGLISAMQIAICNL
jgi:hypothetical protein